MPQQQMMGGFNNRTGTSDVKEILLKGAINHPKKEWASKEEMVLNNDVKITDEGGNQVEVDLNKCANHELRLGSEKVKALGTT